MVRRDGPVGRTGILACCAVALLGHVGCDSGKPASPGEAKPSASGDAAPSTATPSGSTGQSAQPVPPDHYGDRVIEGIVKLGSALPPARPLQLTADPVCARLHGGKPVFPQGRDVGAEGLLPHVFVYIKRGLDGRYTPPAEPVVLDQRSCIYVPHVFGILCGQTLEIRNGDPTAHNVHALARKNEAFNIAQANQGAKATKVFNRPEVMLKIKCDVHSWMEAYAGVLAHPFFAVTAEDGAFRIPRLPPGQYTVEAWHELFGTLSQDVDLSATAGAKLEFVYKKSP